MHRNFDYPFNSRMVFEWWKNREAKSKNTQSTPVKAVKKRKNMNLSNAIFTRDEEMTTHSCVDEECVPTAPAQPTPSKESKGSRMVQLLRMTNRLKAHQP
ncbi:hypothetical protein Ae201684P_022240 [Aphanomyces euteiches]|uniref:Uncharacterized protein n=1 Tax=Aphanomyces euteiches TaxID=100861 RepID=A0A6G0X6M3_9STRA|nr:hypothetical protein Ae201684_007976 [Aphanomyces euteiches]KAH9074433.1 hypothetical protein Ae201684P_022240 [Aphanomyces euteiches]